ncbi:hypothetical protein EQZ23_11015 [Sphingomonas sp. UV9]|uniref:hypothetical protein n=1 Tax=Sphingomonas sp. UV9 TaxID=1851410 RepID=UPI000FFC6180|nr:hypothetical protein [Sphingomonas sp. UV9]RXD05579.1 hypothetical protein EQZ23_11015 [Sphingomonas sp. UV9]
MTPLDRITDCRFDRTRQWAARLAICRFVSGRGDATHPAWRIGSNAPLGSIAADDWEAFVHEPCQFCGAPGADILGGGGGGVGMEYCRACGNDWIVGDYDWRNLADCLRYREDLAAGLVQPDSI